VTAGTMLSGSGVTRSRAVAIVAAFAFTYFLSALLRAVTATLAPVFGSELGLDSADLGLLAGAYFLGFAAMQLPLGHALDRVGPRRVLLALLGVAVAGCVAFALSHGLAALVVARGLIGVGVSACLMAPLTSFRHLFGPSTQLRLNSWMLMTGSLGMLASTLPVQALLPVLGWRGLFVALGALLLAGMALTYSHVPRRTVDVGTGPSADVGSYRLIVRHPAFVALAPLGFFCYGGLIAIQALWAGPWLTQVQGRSAAQAAQGLFAINLSMLVAFLAWGVMMPRFARAGVAAGRLIVWATPASLVVLLVIVQRGAEAGTAHWATWCVLSTVVSLSQPAVAQAFPAALAGRALSAFNLVLFVGVFCLQWGIGLLIDGAARAGHGTVAAYQWAFGAFAACCIVAYAWFLLRQRRMPIIGGEAVRR